MVRAGFLAAVAACSLCGCCTAYNLANDRTPYGGVREAAKCGTENCKALSSPSSYDRIFPALNVAAAAFFFGIEVPLSAVGDTLTLPLTLVNEKGQPAPLSIQSPRAPARPDTAPSRGATAEEGSSR